MILPEAVRIFLAATPREWLPARVLEFSIRERASLPVEVQPLYSFQRPIPTPKARENSPRTPFSFQRFLIPELCGYLGRAIYLDSDMLVFRDIADLWSVPMGEHDVQTVGEASGGRRGQFSVMLLDCARLNWNVDRIVQALDEGRLSYPELMYEMRIASNIGRDIPVEWNSLERYDGPGTALLHYTDMDTQPWVSTRNRNGAHWVACLRRALAQRFINREEVVREVENGNVRPSLLSQIDLDLDDPLALPPAARKLDRHYLAPYNEVLRAGAWTSASAAIGRFLGQRCRESSLFRLFR